MLKHLEFMKEEVDVHPQSGESKEKTLYDLYLYEDQLVVWGWGKVDTLPVEAFDRVKNHFTKKGFALVHES